MTDEKPKKMTAEDVKRALAARWPDDRYLHVYEAPEDKSRQGSKIDMLVMGLWSSQGLYRHAVEVKVSYSDWTKEWRRKEWTWTEPNGHERTMPNKPSAWWIEEMERRAERAGIEWTLGLRSTTIVDTSKSLVWRQHADYFWVAAPLDLARKIKADIEANPEMAGWGVIGVTAVDTRVLLDAERNKTPRDWPRGMWLGIIRAAADSGFQALIRAEQRGYERALRDAKEQAQREAKRRREQEAALPLLYEGVSFT